MFQDVVRGEMTRGEGSGVKWLSHVCDRRCLAEGGGKCGRLELNDDGQYVAEEAARAFGFARVGRYAF